MSGKEINIKISDESTHAGFDSADDCIEQWVVKGYTDFTLSSVRIEEDEEEIIALCNKNAKCRFTLPSEIENIDEEFLSQVKRVKNLTLQIHAKCIDKVSHNPVIQMLKEKKIPFRISGD